MSDIAITQADAVVSITANAAVIPLPNGATILGPLATLPHRVGDYLLLPVLTDGPQPGPDETGATLPPEVVGDVVVIRRTVSPLGPEQIAARADAAAEARRVEIAARLTAIDAASARPLRALATNAATQADLDRLTALESEAASLRAELATLSSPESTPTGA